MSIEIYLASDVDDRPVMFAEVRVNGDVIAEVIYDAARKSYQVTTYSGPDEGWTGVDLDEFRRALLSAKEALVERGFPDVADT